MIAPALLRIEDRIFTASTATLVLTGRLSLTSVEDAASRIESTRAFAVELKVLPGVTYDRETNMLTLATRDPHHTRALLALLIARGGEVTRAELAALDPPAAWGIAEVNLAAYGLIEAAPDRITAAGWLGNEDEAVVWLSANRPEWAVNVEPAPVPQPTPSAAPALHEPVPVTAPVPPPMPLDAPPPSAPAAQSAVPQDFVARTLGVLGALRDELGSLTGEVSDVKTMLRPKRRKTRSDAPTPDTVLFAVCVRCEATKDRRVSGDELHRTLSTPQQRHLQAALRVGFLDGVLAEHREFKWANRYSVSVKDPSAAGWTWEEIKQAAAALRATRAAKNYRVVE